MTNDIVERLLMADLECPYCGTYFPAGRDEDAAREIERLRAEVEKRDRVVAELTEQSLRHIGEYTAKIATLEAEVERLRAELHNAIRLRELALSREAPPLTLDWTYDTAADPISSSVAHMTEGETTDDE